MTGGLALRRIERSDAIGIEALAQGRKTAAWYRLALFTTAKPPTFTEPAPSHKIVGLGMQLTSAPPELAEAGRGEGLWRGRLDRLIDFLAAAARFSRQVAEAGDARALLGPV
jgi:hypothetical protein